MLAYDPGISIAYNVTLTTFSLVLAIVITGLGLALPVQEQRTWAAAAGGCIVGVGVACMHYSGMWAVELPGHIRWSFDLVIVSILVGMLLGAVALTIATGAAAYGRPFWLRYSSRLGSCLITYCDGSG